MSTITDYMTDTGFLRKVLAYLEKTHGVHAVVLDTDGQIVPIPKSVSYAAADQDEFQKFHEAVVRFLRGPHAAAVLWPHMKTPSDMMTAILRGFDEA